MKKIIALILTLATLSLASCEYLPDEIRDMIPSEKVRTVSFTAGYDYGLHQDGKATLLLDYCNIFFDPDKWGVGRINAGDVITMEYRGGELLIQESYPGTVVTKDIEIIDISAQRAEVIELEVKQAGNAIALFEKSGEITSLLTASASPTRRIVLEDESFEDISEKHVGSTVYATGHRDGASFTISAYYEFDPSIAE